MDATSQLGPIELEARQQGRRQTPLGGALLIRCVGCHNGVPMALQSSGHGLQRAAPLGIAALGQVQGAAMHPLGAVQEFRRRADHGQNVGGAGVL